MRRSRRIAAFGLGLMLMAGQAGRAGANDSSSELAAGGLVLVRTDNITMQREDLTLSPSEVRVRYEFRNDTGHPVTLRVAFPMPEIPKDTPAGMATETAYNVSMPPVTNPNFMQFRVWADGQEVAPELEIRATLPDGRDVSDAIRQIGGLPLLLHPRIFERGIRSGPARSNSDWDIGAAARSELEAIGALEQEDDIYDLKWTTRITYHWMQTFRPGVTVLEHSYRPIIGSHVFEMSENEPLNHAEKQRYCIDRATERTIRSMNRHGDLSAFTLGYVLQTAKNWRGPIGTFHMTLRGDEVKLQGAPASKVRLVSLCTDLSLRQTGPMQFEAVAQDYVPAYDLLVLFLAD